MEKINPKAVRFTIGVRNQKDITLYPLSLADEIEFSEKILGIVRGYDDVVNPVMPEIPEDDENISDKIQDFITSEEAMESTEVRIAEYVIKAIRENLLELLKYATDDDVTLKDLDNEQFVELCDVLYTMNFEGAAGKFKSLLLKVRKLLPSSMPSENLSSVPVTDTNTSSPSVSEKEA